MIIYEFSTWFTPKGKLFTVTEIEAEEKEKTYRTKDNSIIKKSEINCLTNHFGNRMYRIDNDAKPYIEAMVQRCKRSVSNCENELKNAKENLAKWEELAERSGE